MTYLRRLLVLAAAFALASCGNVTNGTSVLPSQTQTPLAGLGALTFAVGTAHLQDGTTGLNVVAYLRQKNGSTAYLVDTPSIAGPSGFTVPTNSATSGNVDAGTSSITGTPQGGAAATTFGTSGGVYGGGIGPFNATQSASNFYPGNPPPYATPFYSLGSGATGAVSLLIGEPAITTPFYNIDYPTGFAGYLPGFTAFEAAPVAGTYTMKVNVAAANAASTTVTGTASLSSTTPLGAVAAPAFTSDGAGGGTVTFTAPAGATESIVFFENTGASGSASPAAYYSVLVSGTGAQTATLPDNVGPCSRSTTGALILNACPNATETGPSYQTGESYSITVVSFDYPDFEATQPGSTSQKPTVLGSAGQADISISPATTGTY